MRQSVFWGRMCDPALFLCRKMEYNYKMVKKTDHRLILTGIKNMKEYSVDNTAAGMTLIRYLNRVLPGAPSSLLYAQLRKKNIILNGKKAKGGEKLNADDMIRVYFSDETIAKFSFDSETGGDDPAGSGSADVDVSDVSVLFENDDIIALDKPAGVLSQSDEPGGISLNEKLIAFLLGRKDVSPGSLTVFKPSVCNRLDRNTSGIVLCSKTLRGARNLSEELKERSAEKYYVCIVKGCFDINGTVENFLTKDKAANQVRITDRPLSSSSVPIATGYECLEVLHTGVGDLSLVRAKLITGKSHQIRAQLSYLGHPIAGDPKYGDPFLNREMKRVYGTDRQLLHAKRVVLSDGTAIESPLPGDFRRVISPK